MVVGQPVTSASRARSSLESAPWASAGTQALLRCEWWSLATDGRVHSRPLRLRATCSGRRIGGRLMLALALAS